MVSLPQPEYVAVSGLGSGRQKKEAKMKAAEACLAKLQELCVAHAAEKCSVGHKHPVSCLQEFCQFFAFPSPAFEEMVDIAQPILNKGLFRQSCVVRVGSTFLKDGKSLLQLLPSPMHSLGSRAQSPSRSTPSPVMWKEPPRASPQQLAFSPGWAAPPRSPATSSRDQHRDMYVISSGRKFVVIEPNEPIRVKMEIEPPFDFHGICD